MPASPHGPAPGEFLARCIGCLLLASCGPEGRAEMRLPDPIAAKKAAVYARYAGKDEGFRRLGAAREGEWLYHFRELGQTLEEFRAEVKPGEAAGKGVRLVVFGAWPKEADPIREGVLEHLRAYYGIEAGADGAIEAPARWRRPGGAQWDADRVIDALSGRVGGNDLAVLGFTADDLGSGRLQFVFGLGSREKRTGAFSIARYGTPGRSAEEDRRILRRALGVSVHEVGHILGMGHCIFYACAMNGSNSLEETDRRPLGLCPLCEEKARLALGFDPEERARRLAELYRRLAIEP